MAPLANSLQAAALLLSIFLTKATAQGNEDSSTYIDNTPETTTSSAPTPGETIDDAPSSDPNSSRNDENHQRAFEYYFVFIAFAFAIAALVFYFIIRRQRKRRAQAVLGYSQYRRQGQAAGSGGRVWNGAGFGGYFGGGGQRAERQEGLNEEGEAPPPYVPKSSRQSRDGGGGEGVAVPLQTLGRQDAGLKPPEYEQFGTREVDGRASGSGALGPRDVNEGWSMMRPRP